MAQPLEESGLGGDHPLQRFNDYSGQLLMMGFDYPCGCVDVVEWRYQHQVPNDARYTGVVGLGLGKFLRCGRCNAHLGVIAGPVVPTLEFEHFVAFPIGPRSPHGLEASVGAAGGEPDLLGAGNSLYQHLRKHDSLLVGGEKRAALFHCFDDGLGDGGVGVAQYHWTGTHQPVNVLVAADVVQVRTSPFADQEAEVVPDCHVPGVSPGQVLGCLCQQLGFQWGAVCHRSASRIIHG